MIRYQVLLEVIAWTGVEVEASSKADAREIAYRRVKDHSVTVGLTEVLNDDTSVDVEEE